MRLALLQLEQVHYAPILKDVSAAWDTGQVIGIIGPNGAGKSTLLRIIAGVWRATSGQIHVDGRSLYSMAIRDRARFMSFMPQQVPEDIGFTVTEFIEMGLYAHRKFLGSVEQATYQRVGEAIERLSLAKFAQIPMFELSGGERQRVAIARCLVQGSPIILLDEPIANLDLHYQLDILTGLRRLADDGHLVVLSIHNLELAAKYCSAVLLLKDGQPFSAGSPEEVISESALQVVFGMSAHLFADPYTGSLRLSLPM